MTDRLIYCRHACELVRSHGESGTTARLLPFTADGLIWAASMVVLDASRRNHRTPRLREGGLVGQQGRQLRAQFGGVGMPVRGDGMLGGCGDQLAGLAADRQRAADVVGDRAALAEARGSGVPGTAPVPRPARYRAGGCSGAPPSSAR